MSTDHQPVPATRTVVITGAAGALGQAVVARFHGEGARLALFGRDPHGLRTQLAELAEDALLLGADVTSQESVSLAMQQVIERFGSVDVLVHVAGGFELSGPLQGLTRAVWDRMLDLNAWSFVTVCHDVVPLMRVQKRGSIIAVSSRAAWQGAADMAAYSASKSALQRLVESLSQELRGDGINVNSIAPGTLDTPANRRAMPGVDPHGWVSTERAAAAIAFLASDAGSVIHGQHLQLGV